MTDAPTIAVNPAQPENVFEREETVSDWDQEYYHPIAEKYYDVAVPDMLRAMGAKPGNHVIDAGCGPGVHSIRAVKYGCTVTAIDLSHTMLAHAKERSIKAGVESKIKFQQDDLTKLSLPDNSFDFVFNWGVIIHVPDTMAALDNLTRITKSGGKLALHITNEKSLDFSFERLIRKILNKPLKGREDTPLGTGVWYEYNDDKLWVLRFNANSLISEMKNRGFTKISRNAAEYTELQWRIKGPFRSALLYFNRLAYKLKFPAALSNTQIIIFQKDL